MSCYNALQIPPGLIDEEQGIIPKTFISNYQLVFLTIIDTSLIDILL